MGTGKAQIVLAGELLVVRAVPRLADVCPDVVVASATATASTASASPGPR
jgi:molybdopterin-guanine dinucleotide biosynthesis protein A